MILLIDVGNTRLKWALWDGQLKDVNALFHEGDPVSRFRHQNWPRAQQVWLACVPSLRDGIPWRETVMAACGIEPQIVIGAAHWNGLRSAYSQPEKLGVDRWLAMVALWAERRAPFCVAAAGTALTFDRVDATGQHLGGLIAPGLGWAQRSLLKVTVTPDPVIQRYHEGLGRHSEEAIRQGSFFAARGVIEHALRAPGVSPQEQRYLTGGDGELLLPHLGPGWTLRPHLVLEGLLALAQANS